MQGRFDRFTERARRVLTHAQEEAQALNQHYIAPEHLLLGLIDEEGGVAARVMAVVGIEPAAIREMITSKLGHGAGRSAGEIGLTPRSKRVIELAVEEARRLGHHYIGTEHLLLGLLAESEAMAAGVLRHLGLDLERARAEVIALLSGSGTAPTSIGSEPPRSPLPAIAPQSYEHLTEGARAAVAMASDEARRFNHNYIGTEHLLLGLIAQREGVATRVLADLGVEPTKVRSALEFIIGRGEGPGPVAGEFALTKRAKRAMALAGEEAQRLGQQDIGTEHLLLGLIREGEGIAAGILESLGINLEKVWSQINIVLAQPGQPRPVPPAPSPPRRRLEYLTVETRRESESRPRVVAFRGPEALEPPLTGAPIEALLEWLGARGWDLTAIDRLDAEHALYFFRRHAMP